MALTSTLLSGSGRLKEAYADFGRRSLKNSSTEDRDATRRIQKALLILEGQQKVREFFLDGFAQEPNGVYGQAMVRAVTGFQQRVFPGQKTKHDGRVGKETCLRYQGNATSKNGRSGPFQSVTFDPPRAGIVSVPPAPTGHAFVRSTEIGCYQHNSCIIEGRGTADATADHRR